MMQGLNFSLFELPTYIVGIPYGFVVLMRETAHMYFFLYQAPISLFLFTLNIKKNVVNINMNSKGNQFLKKSLQTSFINLHDLYILPIRLMSLFSGLRTADFHTVSKSKSVCPALG